MGHDYMISHFSKDLLIVCSKEFDNYMEGSEENIYKIIIICLVF